MGPDRVVVPPLAFEDDLRLPWAVEDMLVEELVPEDGRTQPSIPCQTAGGYHDSAYGASSSVILGGTQLKAELVERPKRGKGTAIVSGYRTFAYLALML